MRRDPTYAEATDGYEVPVVAATTYAFPGVKGPYAGFDAAGDAGNMYEALPQRQVTDRNMPLSQAPSGHRAAAEDDELEIEL